MTPAEKNALAAEAMPALERIVNYNTRRFNNRVQRDEIYSAALGGLAEAIERFVPNGETPISVFAKPRIQGAIYDWIARSGDLPRRLMRQVIALRRADELAEADATLPEPVDKVEATHRLADRLREISAVYVTSAALDEGTTPSEDESADQIMERQQYYLRIRECLSALPAPEKEIVQRFFFDDTPLSQIAQEQGYSRSWACKSLQGALKNLRRRFAQSIEK